MDAIRQRALGVYQRYEKFVPAASFLAGTLFDIATLGRIDALLSLIQQAVYLLVVLLLLGVEVREAKAPLDLSRHKLAPWMIKAWHYREEALHFLLGSLLGSFTLFYFRSSSFMGSFVFFIIIAACLVGNEFAAIRKLGLALRTGLFSICLTSYLFCIVPIAWHSIGFWQFLTALALSLLLFGIAYRGIFVRLGNQAVLKKQLVYPYAGVVAAFLVLYVFRVLPPIPLSLTHIGIYHGVEHVPGGYKVTSMKPFWRFWETGDQLFRYRKGEKIYCFFSVFSPGGFRDSVKVRWLYKDGKHGWQPSDAVPVAIAGGRDLGWRGYSFKANYQPGDWQVRIETTDEREIGRIYLRVEPEPEPSVRVIDERVI